MKNLYRFTQIFSKKYFVLFLIIYFVIGVISSLKVGISHDEFHEQQNWEYNKTLVYNFFENKREIQDFKDKYYGIGFQIVSQPIQYILKNILIEYKNIDPYGAKLISKHFVVFLFFFISGIFLYLILKKIINNKTFCSFSVLLYLIYPYLFGQALFSPKDIPFLSIWVVCTYLSFNIFEKLLERNALNYSNVLLLAISTAFLLSIRVAGVLILFQYLITFIIFISSSKINLSSFFKKFYLKLVIFLFFLIFFTYILYPVFWINPLSIVAAVKQMASFYNDVCTNTLGTCMYAKNLPPTYIPIWLSVKLPLFILIGILLIPFTEKKIFIDKKKIIFFGTILGTSIFIPLILIFKKVHLYDELRHIMFLIPLLFILGSVSLYIFSKKIFYVAGFLTLSLFIFENIRINPYQYVWFNLPSRYIDLTNKFELEYQGISGKEIAKHISSLKTENLCILVSPKHTVKPFLDPKLFDCFDNWQLIDTNYKRPFLAVQHVRNIKKGKPFKCEIIYDTSFELLFHKKKFVTGNLLKCY